MLPVFALGPSRCAAAVVGPTFLVVVVVLLSWEWSMVPSGL